MSAADRGARLGGDAARARSIGWPQSLRTAVRIVLGSRFAMWMAWGPELTFFYNDAYAADTLASSTRGRSASAPTRSGRRSGRTSARASSRSSRPAPRPGTRACGCSWSAAATARRPTTRSPTARCATSDGEHGRDAVRGRRGDRAGDRRAAPGDAARARGRRGRGDHRARPVRRRRPQPRRRNREDLPFAFAYTIGDDGRLAGRVRRARRTGRRRAARRRPPSSSWRAGPGLPSGAWEDPPRQALAIELDRPRPPRARRAC